MEFTDRASIGSPAPVASGMTCSFAVGSARIMLVRPQVAATPAVVLKTRVSPAVWAVPGGVSAIVPAGAPARFLSAARSPLSARVAATGLAPTGTTAWTNSPVTAAATRAEAG